MSRNGTRPKFALNTRVEWESQAGGRTKRKEGIVFAILPPGTCPAVSSSGKGWGGARDHESYVILVERPYKNGRGVAKEYYWPVVSVLRSVQPPQSEVAPPSTVQF